MGLIQDLKKGNLTLARKVDELQNEIDNLRVENRELKFQKHDLIVENDGLKIIIKNNKSNENDILNYVGGLIKRFGGSLE